MIIPSSISSFEFNLLIFYNVATLGLGNRPSESFSITFLVSGPETLITEIPEIPDPDDNA